MKGYKHRECAVCDTEIGFNESFENIVIDGKLQPVCWSCADELDQDVDVAEGE